MSFIDTAKEYAGAFLEQIVENLQEQDGVESIEEHIDVFSALIKDWILTKLDVEPKKITLSGTGVRVDPGDHFTDGGLRLVNGSISPMWITYQRMPEKEKKESLIEFFNRKNEGRAKITVEDIAEEL